MAFEKLKQLRQKYGKEEDDGGDFDLDDLEDLDLSDDDIDDDFDDEEEEDDWSQCNDSSRIKYSIFAKYCLF